MIPSFRRSVCRLLPTSAGVLIAVAIAVPGFLAAQVGPQQGRPDPDYELGAQKLKDKAYDDAYDAFRRSYRANPTSTRSVLGMVEVLIAQDRREEALGLLQVEIRKSPANRELSLEYANILVRSGFYDQALVELNRILRTVDPRSREAGQVYLRIAEAYRGKGDATSALTALNRARDLTPDDVPVLLTLALTWDNIGKKDQAIRYYREALKRDAENAIALNNLAYAILEAGGDPDEALKLATHATEVMPNSSDARDTLGWAYLKKNQPDRAIETLLPIVTAKTFKKLYRDHLAAALEQKGDNSPEAQELRTLLRGKPGENEERLQKLLQTLSH